MADVSVKIKKVPRDNETYLGVEYIESTGQQYLQIGASVDYDTTNLYIEYQYTDVTGTSSYSQGAIYSISSYRKPYSDMLWVAFASAGYGLYSYAYGSNNTKSFSENATLTKCKLERNSSGVFLNDIKQDVPTYTPKGDSTSNITLFALNYGNDEDIIMKSKMRIYAFKLGNDKGFKYDLIPCVRKSDNVAGMYDTINKKFYTNAGVGEFVVGQINNKNYYDNELVIDKNNGLKSVESLSQSTGQPKEIFYGVTPNSGSLEILDIDGSIREMIMRGELSNSNIGIDLFANGKQVQSHISTDSFYNDNTKILSIETSNLANLLNNITYIGYKYPNRSENIANILFDVLSKLNVILFGQDYIFTKEHFKDMLSNKYDLDMTIYEYLESIIIKYPVIDSGQTYRDVLDSICLIAQIQMYFDDYNNIKFVSARPILLDNKKKIFIPKRGMLGQLDYDVILKNKYNNVELNRFNVEDFTKQDADVFSFAFNPILSYEGYKTDSVLDYSGGGYFGSFVRVESYYTQGEVTFDKEQSNNLVQVLRANQPQKVEDKEIGEEKYSDNVYTSYTIQQFYEDVDKNFYNSFRAFGDEPYDISSLTTTNTEGSGLLTHPHAQQSAVLNTAEANLPDDSEIIVEEHDTYYKVKYKILTGKLEGILQSNTIDGSNYERYIANIKKYICTEVSILINGILRTITFNETPSGQSTNPQGLSVVLNSNKLIQTNLIVDNIKNNIVFDYKDGISNATVSIPCIDFYNENNEKILDWNNGDIIKVNDIVYFYNDKYSNNSQRYWVVKGRRFRKTGIPLIDLELQEVKVID